MTPPQVRPVDPELEEALGDFFLMLAAAGDERSFHPHPLTREAAGQIAHRDGADVYLVLVDAGRVVAYGMLRGWEAGYEIPALGIAVDPERRGEGLGRRLMGALHAAARDRGASRIRLKVYPENHVAVSLYRSLGYEFAGEEQGQLVGFLDLTHG